MKASGKEEDHLDRSTGHNDVGPLGQVIWIQGYTEQIDKRPSRRAKVKRVIFKITKTVFILIIPPVQLSNFF
jgi:hypothetical protein